MRRHLRPLHHSCLHRRGPPPGVHLRAAARMGQGGSCCVHLRARVRVCLCVWGGCITWGQTCLPTHPCQCAEPWMGPYCAATCGRCDATPCADATPPGGYTCEQQRSWGKVRARGARACLRVCAAGAGGGCLLASTPPPHPHPPTGSAPRTGWRLVATARARAGGATAWPARKAWRAAWPPPRAWGAAAAAAAHAAAWMCRPPACSPAASKRRVCVCVCVLAGWWAGVGGSCVCAYPPPTCPPRRGGACAAPSTPPPFVPPRAGTARCQMRRGATTCRRPTPPGAPAWLAPLARPPIRQPDSFSQSPPSPTPLAHTYALPTRAQLPGCPCSRALRLALRAAGGVLPRRLRCLPPPHRRCSK